MSEEKRSRMDGTTAVPNVADLSIAAASTRPNQVHRVSRAPLNFWLDAVLTVPFVSQAIVATIVLFVFPLGTGARGWALKR